MDVIFEVTEAISVVVNSYTLSKLLQMTLRSEIEPIAVHPDRQRR